MTVDAVRPPVVAGTFYPDDRGSLTRVVDRLLTATRPWSAAMPWGIVVPHAGYRYSGPVAATAYAAVLAARDVLERVVIIGPAHFVPLMGCAVPSIGTWRTPLGDAPIDAEQREVAITAGCAIDDEPHAHEHALEVQLPFLQRVLGKRLRFLPIAVGQMPCEDVATVLSSLAPHTDIVVVSTDLSHYHDLATARLLDRRTSDAIRALDAGAIGPSDVCGVFALRGAVAFACQAGMSIRLLDLRTSGDTSGDPARVVGYGAFAIAR